MSPTRSPANPTRIDERADGQHADAHLGDGRDGERDAAVHRYRRVLRADGQDDDHHARATALFNAIQAGDLPYRPLYTTSYVLTEFVTLGLARANYTLAATALRRVRASPLVTVLHPDEPLFAAVCDEFYRYDDQDISLVDHATSVLADELDVEHVFTFDPDDFRTLGFTAVPDDTGEA